LYTPSLGRISQTCKQPSSKARTKLLTSQAGCRLNENEWNSVRNQTRQQHNSDIIYTPHRPIPSRVAASKNAAIINDSNCLWSLGTNGNGPGRLGMHGVRKCPTTIIPQSNSKDCKHTLARQNSNKELRSYGHTQKPGFH